MDYGFEAERAERRRRFVRSLPWLIPVMLVVLPLFFIGIGKLVEWLWRVTLVDIFAIKPISFWQAWGLILLSQIFFKANMRPTTRTGRWGRYRTSREGHGTGSEPTPSAGASL